MVDDHGVVGGRKLGRRGWPAASLLLATLAATLWSCGPCPKQELRAARPDERLRPQVIVLNLSRARPSPHITQVEVPPKAVGVFSWQLMGSNRQEASGYIVSIGIEADVAALSPPLMAGYEYWVVENRPNDGDTGAPFQFTLMTTAIVDPARQTDRQLRDLVGLLTGGGDVLPPQPIEPVAVPMAGPPAVPVATCGAAAGMSCKSAATGAQRWVSISFVVPANKAPQRAPTWFWASGLKPDLFGTGVASTGDELTFNATMQAGHPATWRCAGPSPVGNPARRCDTSQPPAVTSPP